MDNELTKLLSEFPNKRWDYHTLCSNPNFTLDNIKTLISTNKVKYIFKAISWNPNVTLEFIEENMESFRNHNFFGEKINMISFNPNITIDFLKKYRNEELNWSCISRNKNFTPKIIEENNLPCGWYGISFNPNLDLKFIKKHIDKLNPRVLFENECLNEEIFLFLLENIPNTEEYDWGEISSTIKIEIVEKYPLLKWDYDLLSCNLNITREFIEKNINEYPPYGKFDWYSLCANPNVDLEFVLSVFYHPFSIDPSILTISHLEKKVDEIKFNWVGLSNNASTTLKTIEKYPNLPWVFETDGLSANPNITLEFIRKHQDKSWDWNDLGFNKFKFDKGLERVHLNKLKKIREKVKSFKIKKWYKLYLLTKEEKFYKWYCAPGNVGNKVDKQRIMDHFAETFRVD